MTNIFDKVKKYSRCIFPSLLALLVSASAICFLAHSFKASEVSFSPSQIYELTGANEKEIDFSSKIEEELSGLFD